MDKNPLKAIEENFSYLTKVQKKIGDYILQNPSEVVLLTINQLADIVNTSTTTVMRFTENIGYTGYSELQQHLKAYVLSMSDPQKRLERKLEVVGTDELWIKCVTYNIEKIHSLAELITDDKLAKVLDFITNAEHIYCLGVRSGLPVTQFLSYGLNRSLGNTRQFLPDEFMDEYYNLTAKDLIIVTSFPRYVKSLVDLVSIAKKDKKLKVISLTDSYYAPVNDYSDIVIPCNSDSLAFHNSPISAMIVADYIISAVARESKKVTKERLSTTNLLSRKINYHHN